MMHMQPASLPCACTSLRKASRAVSRVYDDALSDAGLTTSQFAILRTLERNGASPLSRLAEAFVMDRTALYRMLTPMIRAGWVEVAASGRGRAKLASATASGLATMHAAEARWTETQQRIVGTIGAERWRQLQSTLADLAQIAPIR